MAATRAGTMEEQFIEFRNDKIPPPNHVISLAQLQVLPEASLLNLISLCHMSFAEEGQLRLFHKSSNVLYRHNFYIVTIIHIYLIIFYVKFMYHL